MTANPDENGNTYLPESNEVFDVYGSAALNKKAVEINTIWAKIVAQTMKKYRSDNLDTVGGTPLSSQLSSLSAAAPLLFGASHRYVRLADASFAWPRRTGRDRSLSLRSRHATR